MRIKQKIEEIQQQTAPSKLTSAPEGGHIAKITNEIFKKKQEEECPIVSKPPLSRVKSTFAETVAMSEYRAEYVEKYKNVGEDYGGTKLLNIKGLIFVVPLDPVKMEKGYPDINDDRGPDSNRHGDHSPRDFKSYEYYTQLKSTETNRLISNRKN